MKTKILSVLVGIACLFSFHLEAESVVTTVTPVGSSASAALCSDSHGNLYFCDGVAICRADADGTVTKLTGATVRGFLDGPAATAKFNGVSDIVVDGDGNLIVCDLQNNRIRKLDLSNSTVATIAGTSLAGLSGDGGLAVNATLYNPRSVAFDAAGSLYIADLGNNKIRVIDPSGVISALPLAVSSPSWVRVDRQGSLAFTYGSFYLAKLNLATKVQTPVTGAFPTTLGAFAVDASNNYVFCDGGNNVIRLVDQNRSVSTIIGSGLRGFNGDGLAPLATALSRPSNVVVNNSGSIIFFDSDNQRIRKVTAQTPPSEPLTLSSVSAQPNPVTVGQTVSFSSAISDSASVLWNFADGATCSNLQAVHTYTAAGTYVVTLTAQNGAQSTSATLTVTVNASESNQSNPVPVALNRLSPAKCHAGGFGGNLYVFGANFTAQSVVKWNGQDRPTTFVASDRIKAEIYPDDIAEVATVQVSVDGADPLPFEITPDFTQGPKGDKGDVGPQGPVGPMGPAGAVGPKGDKGDQGYHGDKGERGDHGTEGPQGPKGDRGEQGLKGDKGERGDCGPKGDTGEKGGAGPQGAKGDCGPQGAQGEKGDKGDSAATSKKNSKAQKKR